MVWQIVARGEGHEVVAVSDVGNRHSCGVTNDGMAAVESFIFENAKAGDFVRYPNGAVHKVATMALA